MIIIPKSTSGFSGVLHSNVRCNCWRKPGKGHKISLSLSVLSLQFPMNVYCFKVKKKNLNNSNNHTSIYLKLRPENGKTPPTKGLSHGFQL